MNLHQAVSYKNEDRHVCHSSKRVLDWSYPLCRVRVSTNCREFCPCNTVFMPTLWDAIRATLRAADRSAPPKSVLTGRETDTELRELVMKFSQQCPVGELNRHCPFYTLSGLHYASLKSIVDGMSRASLLAMFEDELQCRRQHPDQCFTSQSRPVDGRRMQSS